jgi:hypothetical protein
LRVGDIRRYSNDNIWVRSTVEFDLSRVDHTDEKCTCKNQ